MSRLPALLVCLAATAGAGAASAAEPLRFGGLRLSFGGEASFAIAPKDDGYFNETDYELNALRLARISLAAELRAGEHVAALTEVRADDFESLRVYALYLRVRPWTSRAFDVQAGLIPTVFGGFTRRPYGAGNVLLGYPLAYQYLTSLRPDAAPASADELARWRGEGWLVYYPIGSPTPDAGLALVNTQRWDTGIQVRLGSGPVELAAALTQGTLSNPIRGGDDNDGKQVAARVTWKPVVGLVLGASGATGEYITRALQGALPADQAGRTHRQWAGGLDFEYSRGYWLVRAEAVASAWDVPRLGTPPLPGQLRALAVMVEGRYRLGPGLSAAARAEHLGFSGIDTSAGRIPWDAPVSRVETALAYSPRRHVQVKAAYQHNWRDGGRVRSEGFAALQLVLWF